MRGFGDIFVGWVAATHQFLSKEYGHAADVASTVPEERAIQVLRCGISQEQLELAQAVYWGSTTRPPRRSSAWSPRATTPAR